MYSPITCQTCSRLFTQLKGAGEAVGGLCGAVYHRFRPALHGAQRRWARLGFVLRLRHHTRQPGGRILGRANLE